MRLSQGLFGVFVSFIHISAAQLLTSGTSQLPACAQSCTLLNQAEAACGGQSQSNQGIWSCFCQSGYLTTLYTTPNGVCDSSCTSPSDNQEVMNWYNANCGTDHGASEHVEGAQTTTSSSSASTAAQTSSAATAAGTIIWATTDIAPSTSDPSAAGNWWLIHYKWVIMLVAIFVGLLLLVVLAVVWKRRHDRRQDTTSAGFNQGITMRAGPATDSNNLIPFNASVGHDSPARTRDAFMPYGYGYARSDSRIGSRTNIPDSGFGRGSPMMYDDTTANLEKSMADDAFSPSGRKKKRVYVREKSIRNPDDKRGNYKQ